jgi:TPR repeat protein
MAPLGLPAACGEMAFLGEIKASKDLDAVDGRGQTLLLRAIHLDYPEAVRLLLDKGADVNKADPDGLSPLMAAAFKDPSEIYRMLLDHRPDINVRRKDGWTALMALAWKGSQFEVTELALRGADVNAENDEHETAYVKARQRGYVNVAEALVAQGAETRKPWIPASPYATTGLAAGQRWALALAAITTLRNGRSVEILGGGPAALGAEQAQELKQWWGIASRDEALDTLRRLELKGQRAQYEAFRQLFEENPGLSDQALVQDLGLDDDGLEQARFVRNERKRLDRRGILAWDLGRIVVVANYAFASGYLSEQEAWEWIMRAAGGIQAAFGSWSAYAQNYMDGRRFSGLKADLPMEAVKELLLDPKAGGPWNTLAWNTKLLEPAKAGPGEARDRVPADAIVPLAELKSAAVDGCAWARYELALRYQNGKIVLGLGEETLRFYMADAAAEGYPWASVAMARYYWKPETMAQSLKAYAKAAEAGIPEAKAMVANAYYTGDGRKKDLHKALSLYSEAAKAGDPGATTMVGDFYHYGYAVPVDLVKAADQYRQAAEEGEPRAAVQLAEMCSSGQGAPYDLKKAAYWLNRAVLRGEAGAKEKLDRLNIAPPGPEVLQAQGSYHPLGSTVFFRWFKDIHQAIKERDPKLKGPFTTFGCRGSADATQDGCLGKQALGCDVMLSSDGKWLQFNVHVVQGRPPHNEFAGKDLARGDCVHLWLREKPALSGRASGGAYTRLDHHLVLAPSNRMGKGSAWSEDLVHSRATVVSTPRDDGYVLAAGLPTSDIGLAGLRPGDRLRFDIAVSVPNEDGSARRVRWRGKDGASEDPDSWGIAELR